MWCTGVAMGAIIVICGANVGRRYLFGSVWSWAEEAMLFLMIVIVFLGAATVTWNGIHLTLDLLVSWMPGRLRAAIVWLCTIAAVATLVLCSTISFQVVKLLYDYNQKSQALELPLWIPQGLICLGFGLMALLIAMRFALVGAGQREPAVQ
jgi:TRAP-type C4-dicarboxylate transport system permease small subunit